MSNTIAVYNFKGGVGKTSTTLSLAHSWARAFKVLLIDCDPQANLSQALIENDDQPLPSTLFSITKQIMHNDTPNIQPLEVHPYLHLIPGDYNMAAIESNSQFISFGHIIYYKLLTAIKYEYDFILLDCPTHFGITVKSFLANIDSILIPAIPDSFSSAGCRKLLKYLSEVEKDKPLNILGIFFNQYRMNTLLHQKTVKEAEKEFGSLILNQKVRESIRVSEANKESSSIYSFTEESDVAEDFLQLSEEVIEKLNTTDLNEAIKKFIGEESYF